MARKKANDQTVSAKGAAPAVAASQGGLPPQANTSTVESPALSQTAAQTKTTPAANNPATEAVKLEPVLRITAKPRKGFRRCGAHHPAQATDHPADRFSEAEILLLKAEPNLIVEDL